MTQIDQLINSNYYEKFNNIIYNSIKKVKHTILVVDDEEDNVQFLKRTLRREYTVFTATSGEEALKIVDERGAEIALIISDQRMPNMTGTEMFLKVYEKFPYIAKVLLTGYTDIDAMIDGVNKCQLSYYITKPIDLDELQLTVKNAINIYELTISKNALLQDLKELFFTTIKSISSALDAKDAYTHGHSHRVTLYSLIMAREMNLDEKLMEEIETAGLLHDIGKIGVPEYILCKPGKLTDEEYDIIKRHPGMGKKILNGISKLNEVSTWISSHHEKWDGTGYSYGLKGEIIPLPARILAIADTYDAMTSNRSYRKGLPHEVAVNEIKRCSGTQFDPELVEIFLKVEHIFEEAINNPVQYYNDYSVLNKIFLYKNQEEARSADEAN